MKDKEETSLFRDREDWLRFGNASCGYLRLFLLGAEGGAPHGSLLEHVWSNTLFKQTSSDNRSLP